MSAPGFMSFALLLPLLLAASHGDDVMDNFGREVTQQDEHIVKSMVSVWYALSAPSSLKIFACAGVVVHERWIMTAAECFSDDLTKYTVTAGRLNLYEQNDLESNYTVSEVLKDEGKKDIALAKLGRDFVANANAQRFSCLDLDNTCSPVHSVCTIYGWGLQVGPTRAMTKGDVTVKGKQFCEHHGLSLSEDHHLCAKGGAYTCLDDQGGPVVCHCRNGRLKLSAVMRLQVQTEFSLECLERTYHTRVSVMSDVIARHDDLRNLTTSSTQNTCFS